MIFRQTINITPL